MRRLGHDNHRCLCKLYEREEKKTKTSSGAKLVRESTRQSNNKEARNIEAAHRLSLARGEVGIRERKQAPTLAELLKKDFLSYVDKELKSKPNTVAYYHYVAKSLAAAKLSGLQLDAITGQHVRWLQGPARRAGGEYPEPRPVNAKACAQARGQMG